MNISQPPRHGGDRLRVAQELGLAQDALVDLSTGVSPYAYPLPPLPGDVLTRLPYPSSALTAAAADYYGVSPSQVLALAGSQQAIQLLPLLRMPGTVLLPRVGYQEHGYWWNRAGHTAVFYEHTDEVAALIRQHRPRALVLIHPNNPTGEYLDPQALSHWLSLLPAGALTVIDEAFIDAEPARSFSSWVGASRVGVSGGGGEQLLVLRSIGKFFGLPGLRLGFALAPPPLLSELSEAMGPWPVSGVAQWAGERLLRDEAWQRSARERLQRASARFAARLPWAERVCTPFFISCRQSPSEALATAQQWLQQGLLLRCYNAGDSAWLRIGLPPQAQIGQVEAALDAMAAMAGV